MQTLVKGYKSKDDHDGKILYSGRDREKALNVLNNPGKGGYIRTELLHAAPQKFRHFPAPKVEEESPEEPPSNPVESGLGDAESTKETSTQPKEPAPKASPKADEAKKPSGK